MATGTIKVPVEWTLAGTSTSSSQTVSFPATATELYFIAREDSSGNNKAAYFNTVQIATIPSEVAKLAIGGYGASSSDNGYAILSYDAANRTVSLSQFRYYTGTSGMLYVYYR